MKRALFFSLTLLFALGGCGGGDPTVQTVTAPSLAVAPHALTLTAGAAPVALFAALSGSEAPLTWSLDGPGALSATQGSSVAYAPPADAEATAQATVTVSAGDLSATVTLTLNPVVTEWFVSTNGSDDAAGTQAKPFRTLTHALSVASSGQKVWLADGTYDAEGGEVWPLPVADGVLLEAAHAGGAVLAGPSDATALSLAGGVSIQGVVFKDFERVFAGGPQAFGAVTLEDVSCDSTGLTFSGAMQATLTGVTFKNLDPQDVALALTGAARLQMTGGSITGAGYDADCEGASGVYARHASVAQFEDVAFSQLSQALSATEYGRVSLTGGTLESSGACDTEQSYQMDSGGISLNGTTVTLTTGTAFWLVGAGTTLVLKDTTVTTSGACVLAAEADSIQLTDSTLSQCSTAIDLSSGRATVTGSELIGNATGIKSDEGTSVTLRGTTVHGGEKALLLYGSVDLGTAADLGGNSLSASTRVLEVHDDYATVNAVGNTWLPNEQGSDAQGHYASQSVTGPISGKNFTLSTGIHFEL